ncbi:MAG: hypothetical protein ACI8UZ_001795 [Akkermansiaceae bacterium]
MFEEEWGQRNEGTDEDKGGAFEGPFALHHGEKKENEEDGENDAMNHAGDTDGSFVAENAFFVDGEVEENDKGEAIEERKEPEEAQGILEHGSGGAFLGEHEFVAFGVEAEGEVDEAIFFLGLADEVAAILFDQVDAFLDVVTLETKAGPGAFSFAPTVDSDGGSA